ncbi:ATP synthase F0 subunit B [Streptomyces sp. NPDC057877]|uniref:ATP synthase F0 subunit B n=1 Tax=Streptomyces sp. NPDC057877 TaxID=3346269 RepID=UPI00369E9C69
MELLPVDIGPLNPLVPDLVVGLVLFALCYAALVRLLKRARAVLELRERMTQGTADQAEEVRARAEEKRDEARAVLAQARHEAARIRRRAEQEGAALIASARADGVRERDGMLAQAAARLESERAAAEAELRVYVSELASELAGRLVGEPLGQSEPTSPATDGR